MLKVCGVAARCSFSHVHDVIQRLDARKRDLVKEIGFEGLLFFPGIRKFDRRFIVWLMCQVDALVQTLVLAEDVRLKFDKFDVARVFGIPCTGKFVGVDGGPSKHVVSKVMAALIGENKSRDRSIKAIKDVVLRDYGPSMTAADCRRFKVAFVVYVMSTVLAPGVRFDHACVDYWDALQDADRIEQYDWAEYVLRRLLDAVVKVKMDLSSKRKVPNITGCSLFLQVLYLDSVDLGVLNVDHCLLPRVRWFGADRMICMIRADCVKCTNEENVREFGKSKLLPASRVCYSWADGIVEFAPLMRNVEHDTINEASLLLADLLQAPVEEGVSFFKIVSSFVGADNTCRIGLAFISVVGPYICGKRVSKFSDAPCGFNGVIMSTGTPHFFQSGQLSSGSCSKPELLKYDQFSHIGERMSSSAKRHCLQESYVENCKPGCVSLSWVPLAMKNGMSGGDECVPASRLLSADGNDPPKLGLKLRYSRDEAVSLLVDMFGDDVAASSLSGGRCNFGSHISGTVHNWVRQIGGEGEIDSFLFDSTVRGYMAHECTSKVEDSNFTWRQIVDSDYMAFVMKRVGCANVDTVSCGLGDRVGLNAVVKCKLMFFPGFVKGRWFCYAWRFDVNVLYVFDPLMKGGGNSDILQFHDIMGKEVFLAVKGESGGKLMPERANRSGIACLYFCFMFDGVRIRGSSDMHDIEVLAPSIICEALQNLRVMVPNFRAKS
ncbi:unnamed protein product [Urochloa decumbens]|uniref:Uncharacterized protein n=1 Tax=Urochloa decumbens TaxID=240449 RepID=A0ABC9AX46_9POAL